ncbi:PH domain-containing protein [Candidatus Leptofilum sp.]|uniref:PH domain-containing protein n=1 Tax=Candidatus Leptofilum sp. TaxID=3241576 RepID=UPI003B59A4E9
MTIQEAQARIKARVWQAVAQSDLDLTALDKNTLESFVDLVTESAMLEIDSELDIPNLKTSQVTIDEDEDEDEFGEEILWQGRPLLSLVFYYTVTNERIKITSGLLGKAHENVELIRVQDIDHSQTFGERLLKIGDITIRSHDPSHPEIVLRNVQNPSDVYEILRRAVLDARKRHNFSYREEM